MRRIDSAAPRCPRAAPALPPTHGLLLATRESLFAPLLYNVCCLRYASHLRRAALLTVHRRAARSPLAAAPLAPRSPPRRSLTARRRVARAACSPPRRPPPRSSLTAPLARRQLAQRQPTRRTPPHRSRSASLTAPLAHFCLSRRAAPSAPRCSRTASRPLAPLASAPLARRITHRTARRLPPGPPHEHSMSTAWARAQAWA